MNFFEMLILSRKMRFEDNGDVMLYGQGIVMLPDELMAEYISRVGNNEDEARELYSAAKEAMLEYKPELSKAYDPAKGAAWMTSTINLYGLGKVEYVGPGLIPIGIMTVENSPYVRLLKGKTDWPVDHILRGIIAGMVSSVLNADYDAIEITCAVNIGDNHCTFVLDKKSSLLRFSSSYKDQVSKVTSNPPSSGTPSG